MATNTQPEPRISIVATSRNDDHGGNLLYRTQHFVDGLITQCRRHGLAAELILVDWNPPSDRPPLADSLSWPEDTSPCQVRVVTVPAEDHSRLEHSDKLPLFQMIAKNVGIRRARGRFVVATNIDILFNDPLIRYLKDRLRTGNLYRVDRYDVPSELPNVPSFDGIIKWCDVEAFRVNRKANTYIRENGRWVKGQPGIFSLVLEKVWQACLGKTKAAAKKCLEIVALLPRLVRSTWRLVRFVFSSILSVRIEDLRIAISRVFLSPVQACKELERRIRSAIPSVIASCANLTKLLLRRARLGCINIARRAANAWQIGIGQIRGLFGRSALRLHTNACGDFTLLSRDDWFRLRGYPEWEIFSWHLDSVLLYQASLNGIKEIDLPQTMRVYHIEHGVGSGYTPEGADVLFKRLRARGIPFLDWEDFKSIIGAMNETRSAGEVILYNDPSWGMANQNLPEVVVGSTAVLDRPAAESLA